MMESLLLVLKFSTKVAHPFDLEFTCSDVEAPGVKPLSESLLIDETVENTVHRDFRDRRNSKSYLSRLQFADHPDFPFLRQMAIQPLQSELATPGLESK